MTWHEAQSSLQLLAEERFGLPRVMLARQARAREDAAAATLETSEVSHA